MADAILKMTGIAKSFPGVRALDRARIEVFPGEVHALMGENGAGKSTFMKILGGMLTPDEGEILFDGIPFSPRGPADAIRLGISMIHQELSPVRDMTVAENIFLGREYARLFGLFLDKRTTVAAADDLLARFGLNVSARARMGDLSIAHMQMIEIIKAVSTGAKLIIMDEPTSSLTDDEIAVLFRTIDGLKRSGVAVIYISHRLDEIFRICDTVTVLRDGQYVDTRPIGDLDRGELIHMMVGRELDSIFPKVEAPIGEPILTVAHLSGGGFSDVSFEARSGEILGFYGLVGAGRSELFRAVFGLDRKTGGSVTLDGRELEARGTADAIARGIAMVTEDRKSHGLVLCRSILENIALPNLGDLSRGPFVDKARERNTCRSISSRMSVRMSGLGQETGNLSGGNQQKVVLCKWLVRKPRLLILDEPTRGIDVGAKAEIYSLMCDFARQGMAIVMISSELPEIMGMSDRVLVLGEGELRGEFKRGEFSQDRILSVALGGKRDGG